MVKEPLPLLGASSYHLGIDVSAPAGTALIALSSGTISFTGFKGANGYMITLLCEDSNYVISYCHVSDSIPVSVGDFVTKGEMIRICWSEKCIWNC